MALRLQVPLPPIFLDLPGDPRVRWSNWIAQLENFFTLRNLTLPENNALSDRAKNVYVATLLGSEGSRILMANPAAATAKTATYAQFKESVLFERPVNPVRAECEFRCRKQGATGSVNDYLTALCTLYADCHNTATTDPTISNNIEQCDLAMQLAIGCYTRCMQEKFLQETEVNLATFVRIMQADETVALSLAALHNEIATTMIAAAFKKQLPVNRTSNQHSTPSHQRKTQPNVTKTCLGCGKTGHTFKSSDCPATGMTCRHCGNLNHFAAVCLRKVNSKKSIHHVQLGMVSYPASSPTPEILVDLSVNHGQITTMLKSMVDTGADISTIQKSVFQRHFAQCTTQSVSTTVHNFDGNTVNDLHGMFTAKVSHGDRQTNVNL